MRRVLALNSGSSTLKFSGYVFEAGREVPLVAGTLRVEDGDDAALLEQVVERVSAACQGPPDCVGHRIVHGGPTFVGPVLVDDEVRRQLDSLRELAPLHLPPALALLDRARSRLPECPHVACFDTAFHHELPEVARRLPLPDEFDASHVRRYGFHGLSCEYVLSALGSPPPERLIIAHLGSGASLTAVKQGRSIDTSMGLTPTGGIPMGTRTGDLDPGVLLHLLQVRGYSPSALDELVNHQSGLKGLGGSSDMQELVRRAEQGDARARGAIEAFAYAIKKQIGAYMAALGGLDCLVFTGGIGEHAPLVRELALRGLSPLGIELDLQANAANASSLSLRTSRTVVRLITANEDLVIARAARSLAEATEA